MVALPRLRRRSTFSLLALLLLALPLQPACSSQPKPPPAHLQTVERMAVASRRAIELFVDGDEAALTALRDFAAQRAELSSWADLRQAWNSRPSLRDAMDPQRTVIESLERDADWPEGPVDDAIKVAGFYQGVDQFLAELDS